MLERTHFYHLAAAHSTLLCCCFALNVTLFQDTGAAAQWLAAHASTNKSTAVIANPLAAKAHGLRIIRENVGDDQRAVTRYLLLSGHALTTAQLQMGAVAVGNKTTLTVALKNVPGALFKA